MALSRMIAYIDLSTGKVEKKVIPLEIRRKFLGGRGLDAYLLYNHVKPGIDPLGPENVVIVSCGLLCGTLASATARYHVMGKSPLTGFLGSCNGGGFFAPEMRLAGFDHLVIKGKAPKPVYIYLHDGEVEIRDASHIWGLTVTQAQQAVRDELKDNDVKCITIGPAGEKLVRFANVISGVKNAGGRTGMGAVMGSKNLKLIAAKGSIDIKIAYPREALEYNKKFVDIITSSKVNQTMGVLGTPFIWGATNSWGGVRVNNFQYNQHLYCDELEPESFHEISVKTFGKYHMAGCFACQVHCRARFRIPEGPYAGIYNEGPEYTTIGAFGGETGTRKALTVLVGNYLCNEYGVDWLELGSLIAWAMELYEKGILTTKETGGIDLRFGNDDAVIEMIHQVCNRSSWLGDVLAEGGLRAAEIIGKDSLKYMIQVKGMQNLHSDERPTPALALNVATASRGSDHLRSRPAIDLYHLPEPVLRKIYSTPIPYNGPLSSDHRAYEGKAWQVFWHQQCYMAVDCLGICKYHTTFLGATHPNFEEWTKVIYYNTGLEFTPEELWEIAWRCNTLERLFNLREGMDINDNSRGDMLNERYFTEPCKRGAPDVIGSKIDKEKFLKMREEFYRYNGWDENGVPTEETLKKLGLDKEPSHLL
jgi:aldehyde:ferredoxin oxidoreductase